MSPGYVAGLVGLLAGAASAAADPCPEPSERLLFHSCWGGAASAELLLLPENGPAPAADARLSVTVTGAYTGRDSREGGLPNPVGLFVADGRIVNPNLARMDGIALVGPDGALSIQHRARVRLGEGPVHDLGDPESRQRFARAAARSGTEVFQSHLLIVDGALDVRERPDAPRFVRRLLFTDRTGWGLWQSEDAITLHRAATEIAARHEPVMALNLDMGSFDYCWRVADGTASRCGVLGRAGTDGLSNLLRAILH